MIILSTDIEASNLTADFGIVLCCGFKEVGKGKAEVPCILDYRGGDLLDKEKRLLAAMSERMLTADVWLTHYGRGYDVPFINSRLLYHRLPTLPPNFPHIDTWKVSRYQLKLRNNRLNTISEFLKTQDEKNKIKPEQWLFALGGDPKSMKYIVEHCRRDVVVLEEVYTRLRPLIADHPGFRLTLGGGVLPRGTCNTCGSTRQQARGFHLTRTRKYQRFQCLNCGSWSKSDKPVAKL